MLELQEHIPFTLTNPVPHVVHVVKLEHPEHPGIHLPHYIKPPQVPSFGTVKYPTVQVPQVALKWPEGLLMHEVQYGITSEQPIQVFDVAFGKPDGHLQTYILGQLQNPIFV